MKINPKKGMETIKQDDAFWLVSCAQHLGEAPIGFETRLDEATGKARETLREVDGLVVSVVVEFPIYGERVGFQPDCAACQAVVLGTQLHMMAVEGDRMQADFEFDREKQRRIEKEWPNMERKIDKFAVNEKWDAATIAKEKANARKILEDYLGSVA